MLVPIKPLWVLSMIPPKSSHALAFTSTSVSCVLQVCCIRSKPIYLKLFDPLMATTCICGLLTRVPVTARCSEKAPPTDILNLFLQQNGLLQGHCAICMDQGGELWRSDD